MSRLEKLRQLLDCDPDDVELRYMLAMELKSTGDYAGALQQFDRCIELNPLYAPAYFHKGNTLLTADRLDEAKAVLQLGVRKATEGGDAHAADEMSELLDSLK